MKILYVSPEVAPFAKTGGLADVSGALPKALAAMGHDIRIVMPLYQSVDASTHDLRLRLPEMIVRIAGEPRIGQVFEGALPNAAVPVYFIAQDQYFNRPGLYSHNGKDYPDNAERFAFFCQAALWTLTALDWRPRVVMCNDWQTALIPIYLHNLEIMRHSEFFHPIKALFTIHNLAYQGLFERDALDRIGLSHSLFSINGLEYYGKISLLKGGILYSDRINTVSPRYAREIQTAEFGCGLEGVLRSRRVSLSGILNGIDPDEWSPDTDALIPSRYSADAPEGKAVCKAELQKRCGLAVDPRVPLIGLISRLADQKGFDLIDAVAPELMRENLQIALLGAGDLKHQETFDRLGAEYPDRLSVHLRFDNELAHWIEAGADMFLMPSRYEPCGLNQLYSLRYGTIPIVRATGGLADSIVDVAGGDENRPGTGVVFEEYRGEAMLGAIRRALTMYADDPESWRRLQQTAMRQDFTWTASAKKYEALLLSMGDQA